MRRLFIVSLLALAVLVGTAQAGGFGNFLKRVIKQPEAAPQPTAAPVQQNNPLGQLFGGQAQSAAAQPAAAAPPSEDTAEGRALKRLLSPMKLDKMPVKEQLEYGEAIACKMVNVLGSTLYDPKAHPELWDYVNLIAGLLAPATFNPEWPFWRVGIIENDEPTAFSTPGGFVFLTTGMLRFCKNEAELAGVIAHEMVHVLRRHGLFVCKRANDEQMKGNIAGRFLGKALKIDASKTAGVLGNMARKGIEFNYGSKEESEADRLAAMWLYMVGYNPGCLAEVVGRIPTGKSRGYKNHPPSASRATAIRAVVDAECPGSAGFTKVEERFAKTLKEGGL